MQDCNYMEKVIHYFNHIPSIHRAFILAGGISFFWLMEYAAPLFRFRYHKWKHAGINLFFTLTTIIINFAFALLIVKTSDWCVQNHIGLLQFIVLPTWVVLIAGLLLLDLIGAYLIHFIQHKIKWMWKFHMIHHADMYVDTTTANRHHPGESVFRALFTLLAVFITGVPIWLIMLYQSASVVFAQFTHANIQLPAFIDHLLSWIIVSPGMHKVHHHYKRPETDTNYGNIFSLWDRLFRTYHFTDAGSIKYGLDVMEGRNTANLKDQLKLPFDTTVKTDY